MIWVGSEGDIGICSVQIKEGPVEGSDGSHALFENEDREDAEGGRDRPGPLHFWH